MSAIENASRLFAELGSLLEPHAIIFDEEDASWSIEIDEETIVDIAFDLEGRALVFTTELGQLPERHEAEMQDILLRFSFLWRETGGAHAALDEEGAAVLVLKEAVDGLDLPRMRTLIAMLTAHRQSWAALLDNAEGPVAGAATAEPPAPGALV